ncbi:MAG TPA: bifunctional homocysteine S-methyltransferase/methylenetetrahydrofolate reductase [Bryobacteraceae bacterium]|nr:bifunctional homocysteine S-methyltransferase/methylenetetrahydrofolate reductase [Bryobacteraceae bacterium]HOQ44810.1 bifunctional homocysteine S-methyltransferase/methylenetetrahydrofolate reductase [Bryobacteraceae bacterium]HPU73561.1 bifunctional homocysteine S-methyltransferase/methylenetetrahydrofolate reductase [Bryobacteraceae bacterium]
MSTKTSSVTSRAAEFRDQLSRRVLVADGAMGTMLYAKGIFINRCYDELNLSAPALVRELHEEYVRAGAEILETNTFGASRIRLAPFGYADNLRAINAAGVRLAREAARDRAFVAGAIGPLGVRIEPLGPTSFAEARAAFREQAEALIEAGIDLLILETFSDIRELREAVFAAREAAGPDLAIIAQVTIDDFGNMPDGTATEAFTRQLDEWPADVIGLNCSAGPKVMLETIEKMLRHSDKPMSAMPNAGHPATVEGRQIYLCSPEYMAQYARRFIQCGVKILGGCCGTTPEHIRAIRAEVRSFQPAHRKAVVTVEEPAAKAQALPAVPLAQKSRLGAKLAERRFVSFVEILPPRGVDATKEIEGAKLCAAEGIDCINVPDGPRASARMSAQVTCQLIQQHAGIEAVLHFCCRDRNILGIQSELLGAHAVGVRNLICITGDPPRMGAYPNATAVFDVDSIGLVNIVSNLNRGLDIGGNPMGSQTSLVIGVGANPGALNLDEELRRFEWKVEAGAEYVVTQPVFDLNLLERFLRRIEHLKIPLIAGIWPLTSYRNAEFMVNELRVPVPEEYMKRMRAADSAEKARQEGIAIARQMVERVRPMVDGVQLSAPFGRYQMAIEVAQAVKA